MLTKTKRLIPSFLVDYGLIHQSNNNHQWYEDGLASILTYSGDTKDDLCLPNDEQLVTQIKKGFAEVKPNDEQLVTQIKEGFAEVKPNDEQLVTHIKEGFAEVKALIVTVILAMGEEQICALKDIWPKYLEGMLAMKLFVLIVPHDMAVFS